LHYALGGAHLERDEMKTYKFEFTEEERSTILTALANHVLFCDDRQSAARGENTKQIWSDMKADANTLHMFVRHRDPVKQVSA
jgi:hypothetical protein